MKSAKTAAKVLVGLRTRQTAVTPVSDHVDVKRGIRLALFEQAIDRLLSERENCDFVIFEIRGNPDSYVQYTLHDGALLAEVAAEGWVSESALLDKERVTGLRCLGFERSGLRANFVRDQLPQEPRRLACLTELLVGAAYRPAVEFDVTVVTRSAMDAAAAQRRSLAVEA